MKKRLSTLLGNQRGDLMVEGIVSSAVATISVLAVTALFFSMNSAAASTAEHTHRYNALRNVTQQVVANNDAPPIGGEAKTIALDGADYTVWTTAADEAAAVPDKVVHETVHVATPRKPGTSCTATQLNGCLVDEVSNLKTEGGFVLKHLAEAGKDISTYKVQLPMQGSGPGTPKEARYLFSLAPSSTERTVTIKVQDVADPVDHVIEAGASGFFYGSVLVEPQSGSAASTAELAFSISGTPDASFEEITVYEGPKAP